MIINPELTAATEISRLLRFPSAIKIDTFAKGRVELLKFRIKPEFHLNNMPVSQIGSHTNSDILICAVERGDLIAIPDGNFILRDNDLLSIIASPQNASTFSSTSALKPVRSKRDDRRRRKARLLHSKPPADDEYQRPHRGK